MEFNRHTFSRLQSELTDNYRVLIKYRWYMIADYSDPIYDNSPGSFYIESLSTRQKFYGNTSLQECSYDELVNYNFDGKKTILLSDLIFMNAQLFLIKSKTVMRLRDTNGILSLKVSCLERRRILKQIKRR